MLFYNEYSLLIVFYSMQNYFLKKNVLVPYLGIVVALCFFGISFASAEEVSPVDVVIPELVVSPEIVSTETPIVDPVASDTLVTSTESIIENVIESPVVEEISHEEVVPLVVSPAPVYYNLPRVIGTGPTGVPKPLANLTMPRLAPPSFEQGVLGEKITIVDTLIKETKRGQKSQKVVDLQNELKELGFFPKRVVSSGLYGPVTDAAVQKYLSEKIIDIDELIAKVHGGEKSDAVRQLQNALKSHGEFSKAIPSTGWYGPVTESAVQKYLANKK